jgi:hypothetical protein
MGYKIEAYLKDGKPNLKIYDLSHNKLCLSWCYAGEPDKADSAQEVQRLFHDLLLLTCRQDLNNQRIFRLSAAQQTA